MERFIAAVRNYPCLWNTAAIEYRDQELKDAAWTELMKETGLASVKEAKLKWKKLRDSYRDALKRQNEMLARSPGNPGKRTYSWKYMGLMHFLQPYMSARKKAGSPPAPAPPPAGNGRAASSSPASSSSAESEPPPARRRARLSSPPPARRRSPPPPDPLDIFFDGMCQSTKRFPLHTQIKIKKCLFGAVIAAEEALLADQQSYAGAGLWPRRSSGSEDDAGAPPS